MDYLEKLEKLRKEKGLTPCELARKAELSDNTIYNWYNERQCKPTVAALKCVCEALNITISAFFADETLGELSVDKVKMLEMWDKMREDDKKSILHIMESLANTFLNNICDAEDILQDLMLTLIRKAKRIKNFDNIYGWVSKVFENMIKDKLRKRKRMVELPLDCVANLAVSPNEDRLIVKEAIESLIDDERFLIYYKYWYKLSLGEISKITKVPKSTIEYRIAKAESKLKKFLKDL